MRPILTLAFILALAISGGAMAQKAQPGSGSTTGPAAGTPVMPSTATQKQNPYITKAGPQTMSGVSGTSAGAPGIEGSPDTQSGRSVGGNR
jgi:hypothetical protein